MAKERNGTWIWEVAKLLAILLLAAAAALAGYGGLRQKIDTVSSDNDKVHQEVPKLDIRVTRVEENVKSIKENLTEQKLIQKEILGKQDEILRELKP